jgi:hypothetical protein
MESLELTIFELGKSMLDCFKPPRRRAPAPAGPPPPPLDPLGSSRISTDMEVAVANWPVTSSG